MLYVRDLKTRAVVPAPGDCLELRTPDGKLAAVFTLSAANSLHVLEPGTPGFEAYAAAANLVPAKLNVLSDK